ncbi:hypothetical protein DEI92_05770 [Curtobacterium sp. MCBD17_034]|uniref:hypothetical protein n=1 Tax=unclassified Curtobacterium TaxID=257496 RepID=UPI000DA9303C|nr:MULTISPECIES: hypothetical protein [unclassified Curtobacterium]PZF61108.1 hypothetical protein DEI92_05770 [Curtobacterium sp. MCBD17_034]PZM40458.1 hypothetical protein DEI90_02005 [Curtobacterium sp. MCBD17_031]
MSGIDTWIQVVGTVVALLGVVVSWVYTARQQQRDARTAERARRAAEQDRHAAAASAERAERTSALSIDTLERIAGALERLARPSGGPPSTPAPSDAGREARAASVPPAPSVSWRIASAPDGGAVLRNTGTASAFDVRLTADPTMPVVVSEPPADLAAGESVAFRAVPDAATRDRTLTVTWRATPDGPTSRWRYPFLPADGASGGDVSASRPAP